MAIHHYKDCYLQCTDIVSLTLLSFIVCFCTEDARSQQLQPLVSFQPATVTLRSNCIYQTDCHDSHSPDSQQQNGIKRWPTLTLEHSSMPAELPQPPRQRWHLPCWQLLWRQPGDRPGRGGQAITIQLIELSWHSS